MLRSRSIKCEESPKTIKCRNPEDVSNFGSAQYEKKIGRDRLRSQWWLWARAASGLSIASSAAQLTFLLLNTFFVGLGR
jgi:hypothetical protein